MDVDAEGEMQHDRNLDSDFVNKNIAPLFKHFSDYSITSNEIRKRIEEAVSSRKRYNINLFDAVTVTNKNVSDYIKGYFSAFRNLNQQTDLEATRNDLTNTFMAMLIDVRPDIEINPLSLHVPMSVM